MKTEPKLIWVLSRSSYLQRLPDVNCYTLLKKTAKTIMVRNYEGSSMIRTDHVLMFDTEEAAREAFAKAKEEAVEHMREELAEVEATEFSCYDCRKQRYSSTKMESE